MKKHTSNIAFHLGFWSGILLFIGLNFYSLAANYGGCMDCYGDFGVPFTLGDGNFKFLEFIWLGLIADIIFALVFSFAIGLTCKFVWAKFTSRRIV